MRSLPTFNPKGRFESVSLDYDEGEAPNAELEIYEDHSKSILATNESPDVGFRWSVNPYRGCIHGCSYCLAGDTRIAMADGTTRPIRDLRVGDVILGTRVEHRQRHVVPTTVRDHWSTRRSAWRLSLADGTELVASAAHRFLTTKGWRHVAEMPGCTTRHLDGDDRLAGVTDRGLVAAHDGRRVRRVRDLGDEIPMFDITTGTGDFIANGVVSHNCYARPSHEYLSFGAGSDFARKIVVKPNAPALLREAFDKPKWKGELVVFSGITDCYQPLEAKLRITRACLEVCAEYRNPVGIITKSPVIERDIDVLQELDRVASARVSVSVPFWDETVARALEPTVTTPARRMRIVETLAKAGVRVGVSVSPIVPGLNDEDIGRVLEAAANAGATHAFFVMLRLPFSVKDVFEQAMRDKLPLRAEKVLRRLREMNDGKLYDSRFGVRGRGQGHHAEAVAALFQRMAEKHGLVAGEVATYEAAETFARPNRSGQTSFGF